MKASELSWHFSIEDVPTSHWEHGNWIEEDWGVTHPHLAVWADYTDDDGEEEDECAFKDLDNAWDGTEPDEYLKLMTEICNRLGCEMDVDESALKEW
jgi:hypothetical protein